MNCVRPWRLKAPKPPLLFLTFFDVNARLADAFYFLRLIEAYDASLRRIYESYKEFNSRPTIDLTPNAFIRTLPNMNVSAVEKSNLIRRRELIMNRVGSHGSISRPEALGLLGVGQTAAGLILRALV